MEKTAAASSSQQEFHGENVKLSPRRYQQELFDKAREGNIIVCLGTGSGKTLIAAMLLKEMLSLFVSSTPYVAVFLVPAVVLVEQQARAIQNFTGLKVGEYSGQNGSLIWDPEKWTADVHDLEVLVMTPQILLNVLQHAMLTFKSIKALVFDECHHCQKNHPYALIMEEFYFKTEFHKRPRILGMTASPVIKKGKSEIECTQNICHLEQMLDAKIVTVEDQSELEWIVPSPNIQVKEYDNVYHSSHSLQSVMKNINALKAKAMTYEGEDDQRNWQEIIERIYRDLEYCLYDLGLWFARHVVSADADIMKESCEDMPDMSVKRKQDTFLRNVYGFLNQSILQGSYEEDIRVNNLKPDFVSNKVSSLVQVLVEFRHLQIKCIVFVDRVVASKALARFLSVVLEPLRCKHITGNQTHREGRSSRKQMSDTIKDFRSGLVDLLVATDVAEEGLDIQDCNLIVKFDFPKTLRSFIQSRGRARVKNSHYVILKDRKDIFQEELLNTFLLSENFVKQTVLGENHQLINVKFREGGDVYEVKTTGAKVSSHSSIQLLNHYCSALPSDEFYHPQPLFTYDQEHSGVKCRITLPPNACIRLIAGDICETKTAAKQAACLKACKVLHTKGDLTDHLLPISHRKDGVMETLMNQPDNKAEKDFLQEALIPIVWSGRPPITSDVVCLHMYNISFCAIHEDKKYSNFALVVKAPLPLEGANFSRMFYLREGQTVSCKLENSKDVLFDSAQVAQAEHFQRTFFSIIIDRGLNQLQLEEESTAADSSWYLLLPIKKHRAHRSAQDSEIDWDKVRNLKSFVEGATSDLNAAEISSPKTRNTVFQFSNGKVSTENVYGLLVRTVYATTMYCIIGILEDMNVESPFPDSRYTNYSNYFELKHGHKLSSQGQCLLKAKHLKEVPNTLIHRPAKKGGYSKDLTDHALDANKSMVEQKRSTVELPPEICRIEFVGFYEELVNTAVILPSLMHWLEDILIANQLKEHLSSQFSEASLVSTEKVLEAITTEKCLKDTSLERLELLGDSFLKYAISCNLFLAHEEANEGFLSTQRKENICNKMLFTLGKKIGLIGYIRDYVFTPKHWVAPCYPSKVRCDENNIRDLHGETSKGVEGKPVVACNKHHRWLQQKTVADAMEALIGAFLEDGGEHTALKFISFFGLKMDVTKMQIERVSTLSQRNLSLNQRFDVRVVEEVLMYTFVHKGLLIEAFTHASFCDHLGKCYQRLEFLGDSVLDFLVTKHLFKEFRDAKPGDLTDLRSTIVSNDSFARMIVEKKLHLHLIENSAALLNCIKNFCLQHESAGGLEEAKCPKVLADVFESLGGAILVDSEFDLGLVWKVFEPILQPLISAGKILLHPVRELKELCQKNLLTCTESLERRDKKCQFSFNVHVDKEVLCGVATFKDKKTAKKQAAVDALAKLKALGYVHAIRSKTLSSQKASNSESTPSKNNSVEVEKDEICRNRDKVCKSNDKKNFLPDLHKGHEMISPGLSQDSLDIPYDTASKPNAQGSIWTYIPQNNVESENLVGSAHQSIHNSEMPWSDIVNKVSSLDISCSSCMDKGHPRAELYEACARNKWKDAEFICSAEEGLPHDKWYTYKAVLQLPPVGEVQCTGDQRKTAKQAMDSAAAELLEWLRSSGYI